MEHKELSCPCNSARTFSECCQPMHLGIVHAQTPEVLMRARYSAFVKQAYDYIIETHHSDYLGGLTAKDLNNGAPEWLGLDVENTVKIDDGHGQVTFKAWYIQDGCIDAIYECSDFIKVNDQWFYTQGQQYTASQPQRNQACVCNSGKKFKQCCLKRI